MESAQLELEDAKSQLEEGRGATLDTSTEGGSAPADASFSSDADAADVARSLTLQNSRLRTALLRLREQSELERSDLEVSEQFSLRLTFCRDAPIFRKWLSLEWTVRTLVDCFY